MGKAVWKEHFSYLYSVILSIALGKSTINLLLYSAIS